jgi:hypothetical protein
MTEVLVMTTVLPVNCVIVKMLLCELRRFDDRSPSDDNSFTRELCHC